MRIHLGTLTVSCSLLLGACAPQPARWTAWRDSGDLPPAPQGFVSNTKRPIGEVFACALEKVGGLGYTVRQVAADAHFLSAEKKTTGPTFGAVAGYDYFSELTVLVTRDTEHDETVLRVTPARTSQHGGRARSGVGLTLTESVKLDARSILNVCAPWT